MVGFGHFGQALDRIWDDLNTVDQETFRSALRHSLVDIMANSQFNDSINEGTTRPTNVTLRFNYWNQALNTTIQDVDSTIQDGEAMQQCLREVGTCAVCPNQLNMDDAVWSNSGGGRQLVHRFCRAFGRH